MNCLKNGRVFWSCVELENKCKLARDVTLSKRSNVCWISYTHIIELALKIIDEPSYIGYLQDALIYM